MTTDLARKGRGAFFTPPEITQFISQWAIRASDDRVLEPSCGEASFLLAASHRLRSLGKEPGTDSLAGSEIHAPSAATARAMLQKEGASARITVGDFFDRNGDARFSAVIGNPPYVRYQQFTGAARSKAQAAALASGVQLPGLASSWAAFVVHSAQFLAPGGRLGLVLPGELLHVNYAAPIRQFLLRRFGRVTLVTFEQRVFPEAMTEVVLLLAEGEGPSEFIHIAQLRDTAGLALLQETLGAAKAWRPSSPGEKWIGALLPGSASQAYLDVLSRGDFTLLSQWGNVSLGAVTGNNDYFALTEAKVKALGLTDTDTIRISPPGSRHFRSVSFTTEGLVTETRLGRSTHLFHPAPLPSKAALAYIEAGEIEGVHLTYKCRVRSPWWRVPLSAVPDLFFTYMNDDVPRFIANQVHAQYLNSLHGIVLHHGFKTKGMDLLPIASLNSITALAAELGGRSYGGGILKLEPREAGLLSVPSVRTLEHASSELAAARRDVADRLRLGDVSGAVAVVDEALLVRVLGVPKRQMRAIQDARLALRERRRSRSGIRA